MSSLAELLEVAATKPDTLAQFLRAIPKKNRNRLVHALENHTKQLNELTRVIRSMADGLARRRKDAAELQDALDALEEAGAYARKAGIHRMSLREINDDIRRVRRARRRRSA